MSFKSRPTHQGLVLSDHVTEEADKPKPYIPAEHFGKMARHLELFIKTWLPKMLHVPIKRLGVEIGQEIPGFDHLPLVVRSDVLRFPERERIAERMLVHFANIDITKPSKLKGGK
jgi:hypothetical protein